jgi:hypothetical protein
LFLGELCANLVLRADFIDRWQFGALVLALTTFGLVASQLCLVEVNSSFGDFAIEAGSLNSWSTFACDAVDAQPPGRYLTLAVNELFEASQLLFGVGGNGFLLFAQAALECIW